MLSCFFPSNDDDDSVHGSIIAVETMGGLFSVVEGSITQNWIGLPIESQLEREPLFSE